MRKHIALVVIVLLAACNKHSDDKPYVPLNPDLKKNYSFKEGSYWIYRDSLTGREDSFIVESYQYLPSSPGGANNYEKVNLSIKEYNAGAFSTDSSFWLLSLTERNFISLLYIHDAPSNEHINVTHLNDDYPFAAGYNPISGITTAIYSNLSLNNVIYSNVTQLIHGANSYYMKDSVGFVKIDMAYQTPRFVWELKRYHINY